MTQRKALKGENPSETKSNHAGIPVLADSLKFKQSLFFTRNTPLLSIPLTDVQQRPGSGGMLKKMLQHTAKGEEKQVEAMLQHDALLALTKGSFQEEWCGGRKWQRISPLQYAAWAGDTSLVDCFRCYLPTTEARQEAFKQLKQVWDSGTEHGIHLSAIYQLLEAYKRYRSKSNSLGWIPAIKIATTLRPSRYSRIQDLGTSQLHSVANLMQWFCSAIPFYPLPDFNRSVRRSLQFKEGEVLDLSSSSELGSHCHSYKEEDKVLDLSPSSELGSDCYLYKADSELFLSPFATLNVDTDYAAIRQFCITRTENLHKQLAELAYVLQHKQAQNPLPRLSSQGIK